MPSQRVGEHVQEENRDCKEVVKKVDALDYGDNFGDANEEVEVGDKNQYAYQQKRNCSL